MYGSFSLAGLWSSFDTDIIGYILVFMILFAIITFVLRKTIFKESKGVLIVISASSALLAVYGLIRENFSIANLMMRFNIPDALQYNFIWMAFLLVFIILWKTRGLGVCLMLIGTFLMVLGFGNLVYSNTEAAIIGAVLFTIGIWLYLRRKIRIPRLKILGMPGTNININTPGGSSRGQGPSPTNRNPRPTHQRTNNELQKKYDFYSKQIKNIQKANNGKIPKKNTKEGRLRHRYIQAMNAIENIAKKQNYRLR